LIGRRISQYEIVEEIARGGMGVVYKARDSRLQRFVAIKALLSESASDVSRKQRFLREAQAASALNSPHIVTIHDILTEEDTDYIVMEFVEGALLSNAIPRDKGLTIEKAINYATQIAAGLQTAHAAGIVHRDLKPSNVIVTSAGWAKILDFGVAKLTPLHRDSKDETITAKGTIVGTAAYMAPEQALGGEVDHRADQFSLGVMLHEMLTGQRPFHGPTMVALLRAIQLDPPRPLRASRPDLPVALESAISRALEKRPQDRYPNIREFAAAIAPFSSKTLPEQVASEKGWASETTWTNVETSLPSDVTVTSARPMPPRPGSERASIGVLPFRSLTQDPEDGFLATGLSSEVVSALSGVPDLRIASHLATFRYRDELPDLQQAAKELNIRYLLTGSLQRSGQRLRVIAELSDAAEGRVVWTRTFKFGVEDLFDVQEQIASSIVGATGGQILKERSENASHTPPESLDAWGLVRKAYHFWNYAFRIEGVSESLNLLRRAVELDPGYATAHAHLGFYLSQRTINFITQDAEADRREALLSVERAMQLAPGDPEVLEAAGLVLFNTGNRDGGVSALRRAVDIAPFNLVAWGYLGLALGWAGEDKDVAESHIILDRLIEQTPDHPSRPYWHYFKILPCLRTDDVEQAVENARKCIELQPAYLIAYVGLALALGKQGRMEEALKQAATVEALNPLFRWDAYEIEALVVTGRPEIAEKLLEGLRAIGKLGV